MSDIQVNSIQYLVIIAEKKKKDEFLSVLYEHGAHSIETSYGHSSVSSSAISSAFGFDVEQSKVVISCLIKRNIAKELIDMLYNKYNFNKPNTGIAFSIPVEGLMF